MSGIDPKWSQEDIEEARKLWLAGKTASAIGLIVGKSRNSVVGKMRRLGIQNRPGVGPGTPAKSLVSKPPTPLPPVVLPPTTSLKPVHGIKNLKPHHCLAILGEVGAGGFAIYCGDPKAGGSSYCEFHHGLYTQPLKERMTHHGKTSQRK